MVPGSKLMDAAPHHQTMADVLAIANDYELFILHTSTPSLLNDVQCAEAIKAKNPHAQIGLIGAHVAILPTETLKTSPAIDFVCRNEFDYTCVEVAQGKPFAEITGLSWRDAAGQIRHNPERELIHDWDSMPSVLPVYHRDLKIEKYFIGYLQHPYVSFYTGRGCPAKCTFCLWPQTIGGHAYRTKSPAAVIKEMEVGKELFGNSVREWMFDDDTFTIDKPRAIEIAKGMKKLKLTWSCNARAHLDYETLKQLRDNGLRLLLVGFESGNQQILNRTKKGLVLDTAREFMRNCRKLGIRVHGTFMIGLPIETQETIEETIRFAEEIDPFSIQVSIAAPYPGTELYQARPPQTGGSTAARCSFQGRGIQVSTLRYDHLSDGRDRGRGRAHVPPLLFPPAADSAIPARDGDGPPDAGPPSARRRRVFRVSAGTQADRTLAPGTRAGQRLTLVGQTILRQATLGQTTLGKRHARTVVIATAVVIFSVVPVVPTCARNAH